jgi:hypothetical protein
MNDKPDFVPALGRAELTADYDRVIAVMTRERRWRTALLDLIAPKSRRRDPRCGRRHGIAGDRHQAPRSGRPGHRP